MTDLPLDLQDAQPIPPRPRRALYQCNFSPDRVYRYTLKNTWDPAGRVIAFIGLNPSTADEYKLDPTVSRCSKWAKKWGYGSLIMLNLFAFRTSKPEIMEAEGDPEGPENNFWLKRICSAVPTIVACWGAGGMFRSRGMFVEQMISGNLALNPRSLHCLGRTAMGHPTHPAARGKHRLPDDLTLQVYRDPMITR